MKAIKRFMAIALVALAAVGVGGSVQAYAANSKVQMVAEQSSIMTKSLLDTDAVDSSKVGEIPVQSGQKIEADKVYILDDTDGSSKYYQISVPSTGLVLVEVMREYGVASIALCDSNRSEIKSLAQATVPDRELGIGYRSFSVNAGTYYIETKGSIGGELIAYGFVAQEVTGNTSAGAAKTVGAGPNNAVQGIFPMGGTVSSYYYTFTLSKQQPMEFVVENYSFDYELNINVTSNGTVPYSNKIGKGESLTLSLDESPQGKYQIVITKPTADTDAFFIVRRTGYMEGMSISVKDATYTGNKLTPTVTVKNGNTTLKKGTDYTVSKSSSKNVGKSSVTITGQGDYKGSATVNFSILPKNVSIKKITAGSKKLTVTWKKSKDVNGYQIRYSLKSNMKSSKKVTVKKNSTVKTTISKLKAKKKYYVQIRTYKKVSGKTYYSTWSKAQNKKTK